MHKALHSRDDIGRLYVSRKEGRKRLDSIEDSMDALIRGLKDYLKKIKERLIIVTNKSTDSIRTNRTTTKIRKQKWEEKQAYGYFMRQTDEISHEKTWVWLRKGHLKRETKSLLIAAQNNIIKK